MPTSTFTEGSELAGGRYTLRRKVGTGGMATVWLAIDSRLARDVAIKVPTAALSADDTFLIRFEREAQTAAALSHPNLVSIYDYGREGERPYLVCEYVDGANLARMRARGDAPGTEDLARAVLEALAHIHAAGIVHRDVKPGNVMIETGSGRILLTDFGISQSGEQTSLTATGLVIGTVSYLAPEVRRGERAGPPSDLYACGVLLSEQLSEDDPDRLVRLVHSLTEKDPTARPRDAQQALELLERRSVVVTSAMPIDPPPAPAPLRRPVPPPPLRPAVRRPPPLAPEAESRGEERPPLITPARLALGAVVAILAAVGVVAALSAGGDPAPTRSSSVRAAGAGSAAAPTDEATTAASTEETSTTATTTPPPVEAATGLPEPAATSDPARGAALNVKGKELLDAGDPASAVPVLRNAVAAYPADASDLDYGYALFNYAQALRLAGDPAAAIPVLERRLQIPDQTEAVQAELDVARAAAGEG
ncbi:MAG: protein kinase [Solirubrobacterales bacterium]